MIEIKNGKVLVDGEEFNNPQILGELILSMAKEQSNQIILKSA